MTLKERCKAAVNRLNTDFPEWWLDRNALYVGDTAALIAGAYLADEKVMNGTAERLIKMAEERIEADVNHIARMQGLARR